MGATSACGEVASVQQPATRPPGQQHSEHQQEPVAQPTALQQQQQRHYGQDQEQPVWHGLVAGAASGLAARVVTYPADTVKARLQVQGAAALRATQQGRVGARPYSGTLDAARTMLLNEGPPSLYRGFAAVMVGVLPANAVYFGSYELSRRLVPRGWGVGADVATGAIAQLAAGLVYTPIDIIKERLQVQALMGGAYKFRGPLEALRSLLAEGGSGGNEGTAGYEQARGTAARSQGLQRPEQLPAWATASCSAGAAAVAAVVTHPADVVKTRLQVMTATAEGRGLTAVLVARQMLAAEGPRSFWSGLGARLLNIAPGCALSWALYEQIKARLALSDGG
ncbi:hypothetical protein MNEG_4029 [Monoraphidium neglectum]|uniref:Uncharacterized protein n=1 Tax=Monoraphidium neglectum TaxID=145388 RepID=A0A0D2LAW5_9CHLO|nr:hypothetical protein MNEG_4029 [Monoraphidium neglectum]KIZ03929.1 hypothetical protein MNEG_4029 [Monoraphidium neglectum]|eukprot:XP_013902948.1 hypothetical protein MNEG_4029 [Monoraphidium neglectum]